MNYLITGGTGFIGAYVARLLAEEGGCVVAYDINPSRDLLGKVLSKEESGRVEVVKGDITDLAHLIRTCQAHHVEKIIHMAGLLTLASSANPALAVRINCDGTANILETARILGLRKVVWASSISVFGPHEKYEKEYVSNDAPHYPSTVYGACKSFCEALAAYYFREYGVDTVGLRYPPIYGAGHREGAAAIVTEELIVKPLLGRPGRVPYGDDTLNWLYVEDAARATVIAAKNTTTETRSFNLGGDVRTVREAIEYMKKLVPNADIDALPGYTQFPSKVDTTPIEKELGYRSEWTDAYRDAIPVGGRLDPQSKIPDPNGDYFWPWREKVWRIGSDYVFRYQTNGGGGWGDPFKKDPELVRQQVRDKYVSIEGAKRDYGVAITGTDDPHREPEKLEIDWEATRRVREEHEMRSSE